MSTPFPSKAVVLSGKIYERLLVFYPKAHREEFGPSMSQLFRDQCRDAWGEARHWALLKLWLRVLPDLLATSLLEHCATLKQRKSMLNRLLFGSRLMPLTAFSVVFTSVFLLFVLTATLVTFLLPESYASTARIRIERDSNEAQPQSDPRQPQSSYDPYFIQTEFEVIQSEIILGKVVDMLNLNTEWVDRFGAGEKLTIPETLAILRKSLYLRPVRNSSVVEIRVFSEKPQEAAKIANAIAEAYQAHRLEQNREWMSARVQALEDQWKKHDARYQAAHDDMEKLRVELNAIASKGSQGGELLAKNQLFVEASQRLEELRQAGTVLRTRIDQQETDLTLPKTSMVQIIDRAFPNPNPVRPNKPRNIILGTLLGIVLGSIAGAGTAGLSFLAGRNSRNKAAVS